MVEEGLGLDRAARRQVQQALGAAGFDVGVADGLFGPRTRAAIRNWQAAQGRRTTGYLDGTAAEALRSAGGSTTAVTQIAPPSSVRSAGTAAQENLFWQSIMNTW